LSHQLKPVLKEPVRWNQSFTSTYQTSPSPTSSTSTTKNHCLMLMLRAAMIKKKDSFTEDESSVAEPGLAYSRGRIRRVIKRKALNKSYRNPITSQTVARKLKTSRIENISRTYQSLKRRSKLGPAKISLRSLRGVPEVIVSDNGPQFSSSEFHAFSNSKEWSFQHTQAAPTTHRATGQQRERSGQQRAS